MTFKKIDENTIRCVLTESDMEENDIGLADFFSSNRDKIHDFLENIMERAREEIGYENDGNMLSMQLMPLPNNGLAITITGSRNREFDDVLGNMQNMLKELAGPARQADGSEHRSGLGKVYLSVNSVKQSCLIKYFQLTYSHADRRLGYIKPVRRCSYASAVAYCPENL